MRAAVGGTTPSGARRSIRSVTTSTSVAGERRQVASRRTGCACSRRCSRARCFSRSSGWSRSWTRMNAASRRARSARRSAGAGSVGEHLRGTRTRPPAERAGRPARARSAHGRRAGRCGCGAAGTSCPCAGRPSTWAASSRPRRHELDRAGARADHGHPLAAQVVAVVPLGGVEGVPVEARPGRAGWRAGGAGPWRRSRASAVRSPAAVATRPAARRVVPAAGADVRVGLDDRRRRRARRRPRAGSAGCPAAAGRGASSRAAGRRRTSRSGSGRRRPRRGRCCGATCRRAPRAFSRIGRRVMP